MTKTRILFLILIPMLFMNTVKVMAQDETITNSTNKLVVVWTSDDPYVAERVALMYTHAAKTQGWFADVTLIIWGPSAKLTAENLKIQENLKIMQKDGVVIEACIACATSYNVVDELKKLDFDVKGMGKPLTDYLKSGAKVLTF
ncbi:MAG: DsrE family protein [Lentimicrobium sp.]|nr:DsrE family protein [Lentimicrobium sp.]